MIPAADEQDAVRIANDTIYGLNASVFTNDVDRARAVAGQLRSGTVGHNAFRTDFGMAFGGFKQSGIGREGGKEGLLPFLETKTVILEGTPDGVRDRRLTPCCVTMCKPISVDDHVIEPAHVFVDHIDPKFRDRAPRIVERDGAEGWLWEDRFYPLIVPGERATRASSAPGEAGRGDDLYARRYEDMIPAAYDVHERVRAMDEDGVWAELLFPTFPRFGGTQFLAGRRQGPRARDGAGVERLDARRVVRGVPRAVHPADADPAVGRAGRGRRDRALRGEGLAGGALRREPAPARAAVVPDRALASGVRGVQRRPACRCRCTSARRSGLIRPSPETTPSVGIALCGINSMSALGDLIFSGAFNGLPNCRVALSEGGAGWVPYVLERLDYTWERSRYEGLQNTGRRRRCSRSTSGSA